MTAPKPRVLARASTAELLCLEFAASIATQVRRYVPYGDTVTLSALQQHVLWTHLHAGLPLEAEQVFRRDVIATSVDQLPLRSEASLARRRATLTRIGEVLGVLDYRDIPYAASAASTPYSGPEVQQLRVWADAQRRGARLNAWALLGLGLGVGLMPRDLCAVTPANIQHRNNRLGVSTGRGFILASDEWAESLTSLASDASDQQAPLFLPSVRNYKNKIGDFTRTSIGTLTPPVPQRMRATWIIARMASGLPVQDLLHQAGVASLDALARFERFLPPSRFEEP